MSNFSRTPQFSWEPALLPAPTSDSSDEYDAMDHKLTTHYEDQSGVVPELHEVDVDQNSDNNPELTPEPEVKVRRSLRQGLGISADMKREDRLARAQELNATTEVNAKIENLLSGPDADQWMSAVLSELDSIKHAGTWRVVQRPPNIQPIGCRWVFAIKTTDGIKSYDGC